MRKIFILTILIGLLGCVKTKLSDISEVYPNSKEIGKIYSIRREVYLVGFYTDNYRDKILEVIEILPDGFMGRFVAFQIPLKINTNIQVIRVLKSNNILENSIIYQIKILNLPNLDKFEVPILLRLGVESYLDSDGKLNKSIFQEVE